VRLDRLDKQSASNSEDTYISSPASTERLIDVNDTDEQDVTHRARLLDIFTNDSAKMLIVSPEDTSKVDVRNSKKDAAEMTIPRTVVTNGAKQTRQNHGRGAAVGRTLVGKKFYNPTPRPAVPVASAASTVPEGGTWGESPSTSNDDAWGSIQEPLKGW